MKLKAILSSIFLVSSASLGSAASVAVMDGDHDVINGGIYLGLTGLGHSATLYSDTAGGYASALASGANAIVIEQGGAGAADVSGLNSFMSAGGTVIILGGNNSITNTLFGMTESYAFAGADLESFGKAAAATGTTFADDAATLRGLSSHHEVTSSVPAGITVYYGTPGNEIVFGKGVGAGSLFYLGWDYCCGGSLAQGNDWYGVLDSAIAFDSTAVIPLPAGLPLMLAGLGAFGILARRRRQ